MNFQTIRLLELKINNSENYKKGINIPLEGMAEQSIYKVETLMIPGFEIFQPYKKSKLSPHAKPYVPMSRRLTCCDNEKKTEEVKRLKARRSIKRFGHANICRVSDLSLSTVRPGRAGIIVYTTIGDKRVYGFGIDRKTLEITDFGGGVRYLDRGDNIGDGNVILGAIREFREESLDVLGSLGPSDLVDCTSVYNRRLMIILVPVKICPIKSVEEFNKKIAEESDHEMSTIFWMHEDLLKRQLECNVPTRDCPYKFYNIVRYVLRGGLFLDPKLV